MKITLNLLVKKMGNYVFGVDYAPYPDDLIEDMYEQRLCGIPVSFYILDLRKTKTYCHNSSKILTHIIDGTNRISGEALAIEGDHSHSWVEGDGCVLDTTMGLIWKKDKYYEMMAIENPKIHSKEETEKYIKETYDGTTIKEVLVALVRDMENNDCGPYTEYLLEHVKRFRQEKNLDIKDYDEKKVLEFLKGLEEMYREIEEFIK